MSLQLLTLLLVSVAQISALQCDCGFNDPLDPTGALYTTFFETNFTTTSRAELGQLYRMLQANITKYGSTREFDPSNVAIDSTGVHLTVKATPSGQPVPSAEIFTNNTDFGFGSYHWSAQTSGVAGTVTAFYLYKSDTNEVDMEYVSKPPDQDQTFLFTVKPQLFTPSGSPLNTTLVTITPSFNMADGLHSYDFVWNSTAVIYGIDGSNWTVPITTNVPSQPGVIAISQWSDGLASYSGGPPTSDSVLTVSRVWAFYNSTVGATLPCVNSKAPCNYGEMVINTTTTTTSSHPSSTGGSKNTKKNGAWRLGPSLMAFVVGLLAFIFIA